MFGRCSRIAHRSTIQDYVIETMLGEKISAQGPLLLKLLWQEYFKHGVLLVGLKAIFPPFTYQHKTKHSAYCNIYNIHCVLFKVSVFCSYHFSLG